MIQVSPAFLAQASTALAQSATAVLAEGAQSFAAILNSLSPTPKKETGAKPATKTELFAELQKKIQALQDLVRRHLAETGAVNSAPLTVEVDSRGKTTVQGDATAANDWEVICAQHDDVRDALAQLASAHEKYSAAAAKESPPHSPSLAEADSPLRLLVRGDAVELLGP